MSLSLGIVGLPNVGKSTLFNTLTEKGVPAENYPFCTIDPSVGIVSVPDERLNALGEFSKSKKSVPAVVEFVDIAGLVSGAAKGEGLGNKFLSHVREVDAIVHLVRAFEDDDVTHVAGKVSPDDDIEIITLELAEADYDVVKKRKDKIAKDAGRGDKDAKAELLVLEKYLEVLKEGKRWVVVDVSEDEKKRVAHLNLLTTKPMLYVLNTEGGECEESMLPASIQKEDVTMLCLNAKSGDGIIPLIKKGYEILNLITFFTTGPDETRAWTVSKGIEAKEAGGAIHSDFKEKFIRADLIPWNTLLDAGSYAEARKKGLVKTVGKEHVVHDGDVLEFRI